MPTNTITLGPDDLLLKAGETWTDRIYVADRSMAIAAIYASDSAATTPIAARVQTKIAHCLDVGDKIVLNEMYCMEGLDVEGVYTVSAVLNVNTVELAEPLADGKSAQHCPICGAGTAIVPRDLTGYTVTGQVRAMYAGQSYSPSVLGNIALGSCEFELTDCKDPCPAIAACQMVDIADAGIAQATIKSIVNYPARQVPASCGYTIAEPAKCIVALSERATAAGDGIEMSLNTDVLASFVAIINQSCGELNMTLDTTGIPVQFCCPVSLKGHDGDAYGPYRYDIAIRSATGANEFIKSGSLYLEPVATIPV